MRAYFSDRQLSHRPQQYMVHGRIVPAFETQARPAMLQQALRDAGMVVHHPTTCFIILKCKHFF